MLLVEISQAFTSSLDKIQDTVPCKDFGADIHDAAANGKLKKLNHILSVKPELLEAVDEEGMTPLLLAASMQELKSVQLLLKMRANPYVVDNDYLNIVEHAKVQCKHTEVSRFLKKQIGFSADKLFQFYEACKEHLNAQIVHAKVHKKKIIIFIGETHGDYKNYQLQKQILKAASELGITTLFSEQSRENPLFTSIDLFAQDKLKMRVLGVDNFTETDEEDTYVRERNKIITTDITRENVDGVMIIGSDHLHGMLEDAETKMDRMQYHVVAFNLSRTVHDDVIECPLSEYSHMAPEIIQIVACEFPRKFPLKNMTL